jgi:diaminobutyrate-2-oxoglutarate transaminase
MVTTRTSGSRPENDVFVRVESRVQSYARSFPAIFTRARGTEVWDAHGRRYLDFLAGAGSLNYGHNNPVLKQALLEYIEADAITHSLDLHTAAKEKFLTAMQEVILAPRGLDYVIQFTGPTGTNAVEAALKLARKATGRTNVIFFTNGFHGVSLGALAVTGNEYFRRAGGVGLSGGTAMPYDGYLGEDMDTIAYLDRVLADRSSGIDMPAAVIVETVQGEGGLNTARMQWLRRLQALCRKHKIVFIVDDIQAGCGRTGTFFSFEPAGIQPDIVTLSKSLSGYGLPFSVVLINRALDVWKPAEHNGTFRGNNHAFVTAAAAIEHYWRTPAFSEEIAAKAEHLTDRLQAMVDAFPGDLIKVKGRGMMQGILCADPKRAAAITARAFQNGLIIERAGPEDEVIKCLMPLTTSFDILDEGLDILESAIAEEFAPSGLRSPAAEAVLDESFQAEVLEQAV